MAKPRIFISSTYYDLKHIRSSLKGFIQSLGYESVLSEDGDISYSHHQTLRQSCFDEVGKVDILVLIIGGRYGTNTNDREEVNTDFYTQYESVTRKEFETAITEDIPTYIFIENSVFSEYSLYKKNADNDTINYDSVDSINVFKFIDQISSLDKNNIIKSFTSYGDIENWLRSQLAGKMKQLLDLNKNQTDMKTLSDQITDLKNNNETLKNYLEKLINSQLDEHEEIIRNETERMQHSQLIQNTKKSPFFNYINLIEPSISAEELINILKSSETYEKFRKLITARIKENIKLRDIFVLKHPDSQIIKDINIIRGLAGLEEYELPNEDIF